MHISTALLALLIPACGSHAAQSVGRTYVGETMGTTYSVALVARPSVIARVPIQKNISAILESIDRSMSTYRADSELSRFNHDLSTRWKRVSGPLYRVVEAALRTSVLSHGAFDPTVAPLVDLWGFGPSPRRGRVPTEPQISAALERVGFDLIQIRRQPPAIRKRERDVQLDLSAIAKGFAVDEIAEFLERHAIHDFLVEIGGELRGRGRNARGRPWRVAIEQPVRGERKVQQVVHVDAHAVATSGDYRNYFEVGGRFYSHTINPRTGRPVTHRLASVTVLADSAMRADAFATALMVMGPAAGYEWALEERVAAYFQIRAEGRIAVKYTPAFAPFLVR